MSRVVQMQAEAHAANNEQLRTEAFLTALQTRLQTAQHEIEEKIAETKLMNSLIKHLRDDILKLQTVRREQWVSTLIANTRSRADGRVE